MPRIAPIPWEDLTPKQQAMMKQGEASGAFTDLMPVRILAHADHDAAPDDGDRHPNFPDNLLGGNLLELLRIRSAQLGGCAPCMTSRKTEGATEEVVACLADPMSGTLLSEREKLALEFLELLATDHHSIGDETFRRLAEHFTTAEIVELGTTCGGMIGQHRFMHALDIFGDSEPVIPYEPGKVGKTWDELHADSSRVEAAE